MSGRSKPIGSLGFISRTSYWFCPHPYYVYFFSPYFTITLILHYLIKQNHDINNVSLVKPIYFFRKTREFKSYSCATTYFSCVPTSRTFLKLDGCLWRAPIFCCFVNLDMSEYSSADHLEAFLYHLE